ncbi:hypothetical protein GGTG_07626 [Gaeumannomyces tritici R3-111a-1]|uniref:Uncharacterized protein n=1 Tax=Gaeumannomyces tritici (strain R3-111a-1) TaxID=644352 RepID=J3P278_GAET3|nr:hypothetical protein GGTG_07626 [Gaeumannomyces tritici R3-111a-1]EJT73770.1 hypothetical protein GGTG_07626 [Gaeumannomyces tritici R3-111a-1]
MLSGWAVGRWEKASRLPGSKLMLGAASSSSGYKKRSKRKKEQKRLLLSLEGEQVRNQPVLVFFDRECTGDRTRALSEEWAARAASTPPRRKRRYVSICCDCNTSKGIYMALGGQCTARAGALRGARARPRLIYQAPARRRAPATSLMSRLGSAARSEAICTRCQLAQLQIRCCDVGHHRPPSHAHTGCPGRNLVKSRHHLGNHQA